MGLLVQPPEIFHELGRIPPAEFDENYYVHPSQATGSRLRQSSLVKPREIQAGI
jgi:hypothetical protein